MWRKAGTCATFTGWLSDLSPSSISFVAPVRVRPARGDEIEVIDPDRSRQAYRVTRIAPYDARLAFIACRSASARATESPGSPVMEA